MGCQLLKFDDGNAGLTLTKCSKTITLDIFALAQFFVDSFSQSGPVAGPGPMELMVDISGMWGQNKHSSRYLSRSIMASSTVSPIRLMEVLHGPLYSS